MKRCPRVIAPEVTPSIVAGTTCLPNSSTSQCTGRTNSSVSAPQCMRLGWAAHRARCAPARAAARRWSARARALIGEILGAARIALAAERGQLHRAAGGEGRRGTRGRTLGIESDRHGRAAPAHPLLRLPRRHASHQHGESSRRGKGFDCADADSCARQTVAQTLGEGGAHGGERLGWQLLGAKLDQQVVPLDARAAHGALLPVPVPDLSSGEKPTEAASEICGEAADLMVLPSPLAPWKGAPLRVMVVIEKPVDGVLSLIAPDGSVAVKSPDRHGGPPYFWFADPWRKNRAKIKHIRQCLPPSQSSRSVYQSAL